MDKGKVSVILPFYKNDTPKRFEAAIMSITEQSYKNLEIVLIQDGPVPYELIGTAAKMMARDKRIVLIRNEENMGLKFSLNKAIMESNGTYIARQDADDMSHVMRIEKQMSKMAEKGLDIIGSWFFEKSLEGTKCRMRRMPITEKNIRRTMPITSPFCHGSVIFRKEPIVKLGLYSDDPPNEDYGLWQKAHRSGLKMENIPEALYIFHVDPKVYFKRRRGIKVALSETQIRFRTIREGGYLPHLYIVAGIIFLLRLMPSAVIRYLYIVRDRFSERGTND
jgi:glycosyltransferase EpsE